MPDRLTQVKALYDEHGGAILRYLRRLTGRAQVAEDLLHETFVQALNRWEQLRNPAAARAWLYSIARNLGVNSLRRKIAGSLPDDLVAPPKEEDSRLATMREAIQQLPEALRDTLILRLRDELSYEEIAAVLKVPVGTVRSRLHHAVRQLRDRMKGEQA